jgi:Kef-type K+ transport system membrane component KefB
MELLRQLFQDLPLIGRFAIIFGLIVLLPKLSERFSLPGVVGLMAGGIALGPQFLGLLSPKGGAVELFAELGRLLLMFFAGYEIDPEQFQRVRWKVAGFGVLTFGVPLALGTAVGLAFGYGTNAAILIGSLLSSHTLLGLPVVQGLGLTRRDSVVVTVGATMFTDIAALIVLAVCLPIHVSGFSHQQLAVTLSEIAIYIPLVVFGLSGLARWTNRLLKPGPEMSFALLILMMAIGAFAADAIHLEGIVGAFLTGIAVKRGMGESNAGETLSVVSHTLFIPVFFLSTGFLVDIPAFGRTLLSDGLLVLAVVGALFLGKYLAAEAAGLLIREGNADRLLMWSLSVPQVAATLAAALVAYGTLNAAGARLIDDRMINVVIVLIMVTSVVGPMITRRAGRRLQHIAETEYEDH